MHKAHATAVIAPPPTIWTVGHSTRPLPVFLDLLNSRRIDAIADVRRFPGSRRHPHFAREALEQSLPADGIDYQWLPQLGGRRTPLPATTNTGWRNLSFRGYADHLSSAEFADGLVQLLDFAAPRRCALMCSEALWWQCHRALIADVLTLRGVQVLHLLAEGKEAPHTYTSPARIVDGYLAYPGVAQPDMFEDGDRA